MADIKRLGFGQVEPNHLSAQRTGQIYAQLPAHIKASADDVATIDILENGQFVKYDYENGEVNFTGAGEWMMVFNEIKLYDEREQRYKDYAMIRKDFVPSPNNAWDPAKADKVASLGEMVPRVFKTNVGDIFTTNTVEMANTSNTATVAGATLNVGEVVGPNASGYLSKTGDTTTIKFQVVKITTMPDGQPAVKLMRIA